MTRPGGASVKCALIHSKTLHKRLSEAGRLASTDTKRQRVLVRRKLQGKTRPVLHMKAKALGAVAD